MRKSLLKRIIPAVMVAVLCTGAVSTGASAQSGNFSFGFGYNGYHDSSVLGSSGPSVSNDYLTIIPSYYHNGTDVAYLRVHGKTATDDGSATDWKKITGTAVSVSALVQNYDSRNRYYLRGRASGDATAGSGVIQGIWKTW